MEISNELRKLLDPNNECCCEHCLVHKCKEWASNNQFTLVSGDSGHGFVCSVGHYSNNAINAEFYGENEFNAVIQGCEFILNKIVGDEE